MHEVVFGQCHQLALTLHVVNGSRGIQGRLFRGLDQLKPSPQPFMASAGYGVSRGEAVPQHLRQRQPCAAAGDLLRRFDVAHLGQVGAVVGAEVQPGQIACTGALLRFHLAQVRVQACGDFGVGLQRALGGHPGRLQ
jgi:hypothetical protein